MMNPSSAIFLLTMGVVSAGFSGFPDMDEPQAEWKCTNNYGESMEIDIANGNHKTLNNAQLERLYQRSNEQVDITDGTPIPCYDYTKYVAMTEEVTAWTCTNIKTNEEWKGVNENVVNKPTINHNKVHYRNNLPQVKGYGSRRTTMNACQEQRKNQESRQ